MVSFILLFRSFARAIRRGLQDPEFRALGFLVFIILLTGTLFYRRVEGWSLLDSLYFRWKNAPPDWITKIRPRMMIGIESPHPSPEGRFC